MNAKDFTENNGEMAKWVAKETPAKRWAKPQEVADLTLFLASPESSYLTGQWFLSMAAGQSNKNSVFKAELFIPQRSLFILPEN